MRYNIKCGAALMLCAATVAVSFAEESTDVVAKPQRCDVSYDSFSLADGSDLEIVNVWTYDNALGNGLNHFAQYPQLSAPMVVRNGYLYIPKFKESLPSNQELYIFDAKTGEYITTAEIEGLNTDAYGMRVFENIITTLGTDEDVLISGWNTRIEDADYKTYIAKTANQTLETVYLDFSDPLKPKAGSIVSAPVLHAITASADRAFIKSLSINDFTVVGAYSQDKGRYTLVANTLLSSSYNITSTTSSYAKNRRGFGREKFKFENYAYVKNNSKQFSAYSDDSYRLKTRALSLKPSVSDGWMVANFADSDSKLNNPRLIYTKGSAEGNYTATISEQLPLDETAKHTGNAIEYFQLNGEYYLVYASRADDITRFTIATFPTAARDKIESNSNFDGLQVIWQVPKDGFATTDRTYNGENITTAYVKKSTTKDGNEIADLYLYAQGQGMAAYRIGKQLINTGVRNITDENATINITGKTLTVSRMVQPSVVIYNTQGAEVLTTNQAQTDLSSLQPGLYIARCGTATRKLLLH